ncbi:MAG: hypothetical protein ACK5L5_00370 [Bacteroidales bacterium]
MAIITAILKGERNGKVLSLLADGRCRKSKEEIAQALVGHWSDELLFELQDCYDIYHLFQSKIRMCDNRIEKLLQRFVPGKEEPNRKITKKEHFVRS